MTRLDQMEFSKRARIGALAASVAIVVVFAAYAAIGLLRDGPAQVSIAFTGLVNEPVTISLDDLQSMPSTTVTSELVCVDGRSLGVHDWTGVRLRLLLDERGVIDGAVKVAFFADDRYSTDLTLEDALREDVLIAYLKDGSPLSDGTKLVVPGKWGYKWIDGIAEIRLVDYDFLGFWEGRGYSDDATIPT